MLLLAPEGVPPEPGALARELCHRHFGVGADGLIFLTPTPGGPAMAIYNSDGSEASMCGNGIRCLAALARREGLLEGERAVVSTRSGPREVRVLAGPDPWLVEVDMGEPRFPDGPESVEVGGRACPCVTVDMGNPHRVVFLEDLAGFDLARHGPALSQGRPGGLNVEFTRILAPDHLAVQVWERGAGPTLACGTGACAALVAAARTGRAARSARVDLPGGPLAVSWEPDGRVLMTGPARELFRGAWNPDGGGAGAPPPWNP